MFKVFSVYDGKVKVFSRPFMDQHTGSAQRSFELACKQEESPFAQFPADYVLYEVGTFDEESGRLSANNPVVQVAAAIDHVRRPAVPRSLSSSSSVEAKEASNG